MRNKFDGLWDIPISKTRITPNCCDLPPTHGALHCRQSIPIIKDIIPNPKLTQRNSITHHLLHLCTLVEDNDFDDALLALLLIYKENRPV